MGLEIEGSGNGGINTVAVDSEKRLATLATSENFDAHINRTEGKSWSISFEDLNPTAADDFVIYVKNTGDKVIHMSDARISATAATQLEFHAVTGVAVGGTTNVPLSRTIGSSATMSGISETGVDITGITSSGTAFYMQCPVAGTESHLKTSSRLRIPKGQAMAISVENGSADITGIISIVEEE